MMFSTDVAPQPEQRRLVDEAQWLKPPVKDPPPKMISQFMAGLRTDDEVRQFVSNASRPDEVAVIEYGASWCHHCHQVFPEYYAISRQFPKLRYAVAHIDSLKNEGKHLQKTPTFTFYRNGRRIDEVCGTNMQVVRDRLWLYQD